MDHDLRSIQHARDLAKNGEIAAGKIKNFTKEQIDKILKNVVNECIKNSQRLAEMAVEETGFGNYKDKLYKNHMASSLLYEQIKDKETIGVINADDENGTITIAEPVGLIMGIVPSTNPTSTIFYKSLIALKSRNAIVFSPHPGASKCTLEAVKVVNEAAVEAGAPENIIQAISIGSMQATNELMQANETKLILATGGPAMVKSAYSSGIPAIGVGAGNSPAYIEKSADIKQAVSDIMTSKTFDNGTICASEQSIIVESATKHEVVEEFKANGGYFLTEEETKKVTKTIMNGTNMNPAFVGKEASYIAEKANISIPSGTKVLIGKQEGVGPEWPLSYEKLTCVLAYYEVEDYREACSLSNKLLQNGIGHTMSIHTQDKEIIKELSVLPASRILVNTGGTTGGTGLTTNLAISLTLGCGTIGGSSESENIGSEHLINIKKIAYGNIATSELVEKDELFKKNFSDSNLVTDNKSCHISGLDLGKELDVSDLEDIIKMMMDALNN